jgi:hypothetical protein
MAITKRTVYATNKKDGRMDFTGWAMVETGLGTMVELFFPNMAGSLYDPSDEIARVDEITLVEPGKERMILSGGGPLALHGGNQVPSA